MWRRNVIFLRKSSERMCLAVNMRRLFGLLLALAVCVSISACGQSMATSAQSYIEAAQIHMEKGEYDQAVAVLQEGFSATGDMSLISLMEQAAQGKKQAAEQAEQQPPEQEPVDASGQEQDKEPEAVPGEPTGKPAFDISGYLGEWIESDFCYDYGGMSLKITQISSGADPNYQIKINFIQGAPACRDAEVMVTIPESKLLANKTVSFTEVDSWGTQADFALTFQNGTIQCRISNAKYVYDDLPVWGMTDGSRTLQRGDINQAYAQQTGDPEAFEGEWYPDDPFGPGLYMGAGIDEDQLVLELFHCEGFDESSDFWAPINEVAVRYSVPVDSIVGGTIEFAAQDSCGNWADYTLTVDTDDDWGEVLTCRVKNTRYSGGNYIPDGEY